MAQPTRVSLSYPSETGRLRAMVAEPTVVAEPTIAAPGVKTARVRPPRIPSDQRRAQIVTVAHDVFGSRGFHQASLGDIADRVGLTRQAILHHFGTKEQLLVEVLRYREHRDVEGFDNHEPPRGGEFLRHLVQTAATNTHRLGLVQSYAVLSAESTTENHPAQASFRERFSALRAQIADALILCCPSEDRPDDEEIDRAASCIVAVMDGLQVQWLLDPEQIDMPAAVSLVIDALLTRWGLVERTAGVVT